MISKDIFAISDAADPHILNVGGMPLLVADNFFERPSDIDLLASALDYNIDIRRGAFRQYPGERARISISQRHVIDWIQHQLQAQYGAFSFYDFPAVFTRMNSSALRNADLRQIVPHLDTDSILSVVVHLNRDESETCFYRHVPTGLHYVPPHPTPEIAIVMKQRGFDALSASAYLNFKKDIINSTSEEAGAYTNYSGLPFDTASWKIIHRVPAKWNRLICFVSNVFHSPVYLPKEAAATGRLTMNIFLQIV